MNLDPWLLGYRDFTTSPHKETFSCLGLDTHTHKIKLLQTCPGSVYNGVPDLHLTLQERAGSEGVFGAELRSSGLFKFFFFCSLGLNSDGQCLFICFLCSVHVFFLITKVYSIY